MLSVGFDTSALDPSFKNHAQRGIGRYVKELYEYFCRQQALPVRFGSFNQSTLREPSMVTRFIDALPAFRRTLSQQLVYPLRLGRGKFRDFDVVHFPAHMDAPAWSPKRYILTVLDLIPLVLEDLYRADRPGWRFTFARFLERRAIQNAALILAISENTARDVERILKIPAERIVVTPLGVDERFFAASLLGPENELRAKYNIPQVRPVVLYVGGIDQRKNMPTLVGGFAQAWQRAQEAGLALPVLVMAGNIHKDREYSKLEALISKHDLQAHVVRPGFVADEDLLQLYALSSAFFFPSLYEGFGFPPLEAMAAGVPVLSSNTSSMPEVIGDAAVMFNPTDVQRAGQELFALLYNTEHAKNLRVRGPQRARSFSWDKTGQRTLEAYERFAAMA